MLSMRWEDIAIDGTWTIPAEEREKSNAMELVLPKAALDIIRAQPQLGDNPGRPRQRPLQFHERG